MRGQNTDSTLRRLFWLTLGFLCLGLGFVGAVLPLMPTVVFLLAAAYCFSKSSKRWYDWLMSHKRFGPPIKDWQDNGVIRRRPKIYATISIGLVFIFSIALRLSMRILMVQIIILSAVLLFIWSRPEGKKVHETSWR